MAVETTGSVGPDDRFFSWVSDVDLGLWGRGGCDEDKEPALVVVVVEGALVVALDEDVLVVCSVVNTNFSFFMGGAVPVAASETRHDEKSMRWISIRNGGVSI